MDNKQTSSNSTGNGEPQLVDNAEVKELTAFDAKIKDWPVHASNHKNSAVRVKFVPIDCLETKTIVKLSNKLVPFTALVDAIVDGKITDMTVLLEDDRFECSGTVLATFCEYFVNIRGIPVVDLIRSTPLTVEIFDIIYKWMMADASIDSFEVKNLVKLTSAGYFLKCSELLEVCFTMLDMERFTEIKAFDIIYQMRLYDNLAHVSDALSNRISTCTLMVICSSQFLALTASQVCALLKSNRLAVNSETELLFGALQWLNEDWTNRRTHVLEVLKCIRFAFLSIDILNHWEEERFDEIGPFRRVLEEFVKLPEGKKWIHTCKFYNTVVSNQCLDWGEKHYQDKLNFMIPRRWMQDIRCQYHEEVTQICPNMSVIEFNDFVEYSIILKSSTKFNYENFIKFPTDEEEITLNNKISEKFNVEQGEKSNVLVKKSSVNLGSASETSVSSLKENFKPPKMWEMWDKITYE